MLVCSASVNAQTTMTLQQCLDSALLHNRTLSNAKLDVKLSTEQRKETFTNFFPEVSGSVMAFHTFDKLVKGNGTYPQELAMFGSQFASMVGQPYSFKEMNRGYSATITAIQPIYAGGQITTGHRLTKVQEEVMTLRQRLTEKEVMQKVTECYWQLANVMYNLRTIDAAEKQIDAVHTQVENYVNAGVTTQNDLLKVSIRKQELASTRVKLENARHVLSMLLAQQIGLADRDISIDIDADISVSVPQYVDSNTAAANREELLMSSKNVEAHKLQVKMERGKCLPTFAIGVMGFTSNVGGLSDNIKNTIDTKMTNGMVFGTLSIPITEWWGGSHAIRRQKMKLQQAENDYLDAREQLRIDTEAAWSGVVEAYKQIGIAETTVKQTEENLRMVSGQYKVGSTPITELLDAETLNRQAHDSYSQAKATYQIKLCDYQRKVK